MNLFDTMNDLQIEGKRIMIGISGGINSAAVLCYLKTIVQERPETLYLYYAHFDEHSPDTLKFVKALFEYAKKHFNNVVTEITYNNVMEYFEKSKMIPHPSVSPCTRVLKIEPVRDFIRKHKIDTDLVGYVRNEQRRMLNQIARKLGFKKMTQKGLKEIRDQIRAGSYDGEVSKVLDLIEYFQKGQTHDGQKKYLIRDLTNDDCFDLIKREIGWYPAIYDLRWNNPLIEPFFDDHIEKLNDDQKRIIQNKLGTDQRVFSHNNCLPCKNMQSYEFLMVKLFYPKWYNDALKLQEKIGAKFGRKADKLMHLETSCEYCAFD